ncbi:MAG TPA: hypothetical protein VGE34_00750 [Candidatus Saccharimonadales bacterium]
MGELITGIMHQPNFPVEDLSESNAELLELMMANPDLVMRSHAALEQFSYMFVVSHKSINTAVGHAIDDARRLAALDHGVTTFEAITAMVDGHARVSDSIPVHNQALRLVHFDPRDLEKHFDLSCAEFQEQTPRTAEVIRVSSARFHGHLTDYALLGAALSRKFERDVA